MHGHPNFRELLVSLALLASFLPSSAWADRIAVLEFEGDGSIDDQGMLFLADRVREAALHHLGPQGWEVMDRGNMLVLMEANAEDLAICEGECEVETGRLLGADRVVAGRVVTFGSSLELTLRAYDTHSGGMLASHSGSAADLDEVKVRLDEISAWLFVGKEQVEAAEARGAEAADPATPRIAPHEVNPPQEGSALEAAPEIAPSPHSASLLAVLRFTGDLRKRDLETLAEIARDGARAYHHGGGAVLSREDGLAALYDADTSTVMCARGCEAEQGRVMGVARVIAGRQSMAGGTYRVELELHDVAVGRVLAVESLDAPTFPALCAEVEGGVRVLLAAVPGN